MLYVVEIRRGRADLSALMARTREWLDRQRFEPDAFRCTSDDAGITCRMEFKIESEAIAFAETFGGEVKLMGNKSVL